jgi:hypothetical protein
VAPALAVQVRPTEALPALATRPAGAGGAVPVVPLVFALYSLERALAVVPVSAAIS